MVGFSSHLRATNNISKSKIGNKVASGNSTKLKNIRQDTKYLTRVPSKSGTSSIDRAQQ